MTTCRQAPLLASARSRRLARSTTFFAHGRCRSGLCSEWSGFLHWSARLRSRFRSSGAQGTSLAVYMSVISEPWHGGSSGESSDRGRAAGSLFALRQEPLLTVPLTWSWKNSRQEKKSSSAARSSLAYARPTAAKSQGPRSAAPSSSRFDLAPDSERRRPVLAALFHLSSEDAVRRRFKLEDLRRPRDRSESSRIFLSNRSWLEHLHHHARDSKAVGRRRKLCRPMHALTTGRRHPCPGAHRPKYEFSSFPVTTPTEFAQCSSPLGPLHAPRTMAATVNKTLCPCPSPQRPNRNRRL